MGQLVLIGLVGVLGLADGRGSTRGPGRRLLRIIGLASLATGVSVAVRGARDLGRNLTPMPRPLADAELVETGIYERIRHPLYAAVMLMAFGWTSAMASVRAVVAAGVLAVWLDAKTRREEAWLMDAFPRYGAYRGRTRRFVPGVY